MRGIPIPARFEIRNSVNGKFYWRFRAVNGEVVASSGVYESKDGCRNGIDCIMSSTIFAVISDQTLRPSFLVTLRRILQVQLLKGSKALRGVGAIG